MRDSRSARAQRARHGFQIGERRACGIGNRSALSRKRNAARLPLKERHAEGGFQATDVMADRAGSQVQLFGSVGEVLVPGRSGEHSESRQQGRAYVHGTNIICGSHKKYALH